MKKVLGNKRNKRKVKILEKSLLPDQKVSKIVKTYLPKVKIGSNTEFEIARR